MGYRFYISDINKVNIVSQLINGHVTCILNEMFIDEDYSKDVLDTVKTIIVQLEKDNKIKDINKKNIISLLISNFSHFQDVIDEIETIKNDRHYYKKSMHKKDIDYITLKSKKIKVFKNILIRCSELFSKFNIKVLLLPGMENTEFNNYLISEKAIEGIGCTSFESNCLIFQLTELPKEDKLYFYNTCKSINPAFNEISSWPGILIWNRKNSIFMPLNRKNGYDDLKKIFKVIHNEKANIFTKIKDFDSFKKDTDKYYYILHLSDLHFGKKNTDNKMNTLLSLIEKTNKDLKDGKIKSIVITGDLVDTPKEKNFETFNKFNEKLQEKINVKTVTVYGNHDVFKNGIDSSITREIDSNKKNEEELVINEDLRLIVIRIDSNAEDAGLWAKGKIGEKQLNIIESKLKEINDIDKYLCVAILHHHPVKIQPKSDEQKKLIDIVSNYIEKIQEMGLILVDAKEFINWINRIGIKLVLHGHKHVYNFDTEHGADIIGCGASIGNVNGDYGEGDYLTFNLIKVNKDSNKPEICLTYNQCIGNNIVYLSAEFMGKY